MLIVLGVLLVSLLLLAHTLLVAPNASYVEVFLNDVFGLTDAAYRTFMGQVPSVDFKSLYGAAIYYPAALGFYLDFNTGAVLGFGQFVTAVSLLIMAALTSYRRIPMLHSVILLLFLFLLIVVPMRPGGNYYELTYGIIYTRYGWAALTIVLLFYLEPRTIRQSDLLRDSFVLSLLLVYLFYTKVNFAAVALAFVALNSVTSQYKMRLSVISLSIFLLVFAAIHVFTEYGAAYFNDFYRVVRRVPVFRRGIADPSDYGLLIIISRHLWIFVLCFAALTAAYLSGRRNFFDLAFVTGCIITSVLILDTSDAMSRGLPALVVVFLIFGELARRMEHRIHGDSAPKSWSRYAASISILGMLLAFVSEPIVVGGGALVTYFHKVRGEPSVAEMNLSGFLVRAANADQDHETLGHDEAAHTLFNLRRGNRVLKAREYLPLIAEGVELLKSVPHDNHSVITFEHTNPFSPLLRMRPTKYGYPLFWAEKIHLNYLPRPERYFSDTDYVMVPEIPYSQKQLEKLLTGYGSYLKENFYELKRSPHWRLYARRDSRYIDSPKDDTIK